MEYWTGYNKWHTYSVSQLTEAVTEAFVSKKVELVGKRVEYFNIPCSFDIESSSFYTIENNEKIKNSTMYVWQLGLNGTVILGRTWGEFCTTLAVLAKYLELEYEKRHLIIYVHNLGYEFQFMRKWFNWKNVFAIKQRRPVYCVTDNGIEFRCSYFLSNYSLEYIGNPDNGILKKYPCQKLVGNLDYSLIRHCKTPLTDKEKKYCINDARVVMCYIQEKIEQDNGINNIPLTNTGYVRNYCRKQCYMGNARTEEEIKHIKLTYYSLMKNLIIKDEEEYEQMKRAFMGGFTHAGAMNANKIIDDVGSADITSSYPFVMVAEYFPMSSSTFIGNITNRKLFEKLLVDYCCIFDIKFKNLEPKVGYEHYLSLHRCKTDGLVITNNGRIVSAEECCTTLTELDYDIVKKIYTWDKNNVEIQNMRIYQRGYLPKALIESVLDLYKDKTELKGVYGKEVEYLVSKNMINAAFGMMVTAIIRDEFEYADEWFKKSANVVSQLTSYNKNFNRFLYYGWGIYVTAHARHNLFTAINEFKSDYVYADTDSIKGVNFNNHLDYFKKYNLNIVNKLKKMCEHYNIDFNKCKPKTLKGEEKIIGVWDIEDGYTMFKTCGAKRYIYTTKKLNEYKVVENGKEKIYKSQLGMTVSGLNKKFAVPYLLKEFDNDLDLIMFYFGEGMFIPAGNTGKLTLTYLDHEQGGLVEDYLGEKNVFYEKSSTFSEPQSYYMSLVGDYIKFLEGVYTIEE